MRPRLVVITTATLAASVAIAGGVWATANRPRVAAYPSAAASEGLALIEEPSAARPLDDDPEVTADRYEHAGGCDTVRTAYQAKGAPVPPGSTVTVDEAGNVQLDARFGPSAVIMGDTAAGTCEYLVAASPTMVISGDAVEPASAFTNVVCGSVIGVSFAGADFQGAAGPMFVAVFQGGETGDVWNIVVSTGTFLDTLSNNAFETAAARGTLAAGSLTSNDGARRVVDGTGDRGALHAELTCTPSVRPPTG